MRRVLPLLGSAAKRRFGSCAPRWRARTHTHTHSHIVFFVAVRRGEPGGTGRLRQLCAGFSLCGVQQLSADSAVVRRGGGRAGSAGAATGGNGWGMDGTRVDSVSISASTCVLSMLRSPLWAGDPVPSVTGARGQQPGAMMESWTLLNDSGEAHRVPIS